MWNEVKMYWIWTCTVLATATFTSIRFHFNTRTRATSSRTMHDNHSQSFSFLEPMNEFRSFYYSLCTKMYSCIVTCDIVSIFEGNRFMYLLGKVLTIYIYIYIYISKENFSKHLFTKISWNVMDITYVFPRASLRTDELVDSTHHSVRSARTLRQQSRRLPRQCFQAFDVMYSLLKNDNVSTNVITT